MTYLVERLTELRRHLDHLRAIRPRVSGREALERDLRVVEALDDLAPVEEFLRISRELVTDLPNL